MTPKKKAPAELETRRTSFHHISPYCLITPTYLQSQGRAKKELRKS
jgi:hypothetical protein